MGAFSYIIGQMLFLQFSLNFELDFSPASWEVLRTLIKELSLFLFQDNTLRTKHRKYLTKLIWRTDLGSDKAKFTPAKNDNLNKVSQVIRTTMMHTTLSLCWW